MTRYLPLSDQDARGNGNLAGFAVDLPPSAKLAGLRLHLPGIGILVSGVDFDVEQAEGGPEPPPGTRNPFGRSGRLTPPRKSHLKLRPHWLLTREQLADTTPLLEVRSERSSSEAFRHEDERLREMREWAIGYLDDQPTPVDRRLLWEVVQQGMSTLLFVTQWWVSTNEGVLIRCLDPAHARYPQLIPEWRKGASASTPLEGAALAGANGLFVDESTLAAEGLWYAEQPIWLASSDEPADAPPENAILDQKRCYRFHMLGPLPRPSSWQFKGFERFAFEASRQVDERAVVRGNSARTADRGDWRRRSILEPILQRIRWAIMRNLSIPASLRGAGLEDAMERQLIDNPLTLSFLLADHNGGFRFVFDFEQIAYLEDRLADSGHDWEAADIAGLAPAAVLGDIQEHLITRHEKGFEHPEHPTAFRAVFLAGARCESATWIPIPGQLSGGTEVGAIVVAQIVWPTTAPPLIPDLRLALHKAIQEQATFVYTGAQMADYQSSYGKFEFIRSVAWFLSHNLSKTTVTPLLNLSARLPTTDPAELPQQAVRIRAIANLMQSQLSALDIFRRPGTDRLTLDPIDLGATLEEVHLVFEALCDERVTARKGFRPYREAMTLRISNELTQEVPIRGYPPAVFHILLVPIDNALKAQTEAIIKAEPSRGEIRLRVRPASHGGIEVSVSDRGQGIDPAGLEPLQSMLDEIADGAPKGRGLDIERFLAHRQGQRLGLGLPLAAYFLGLLQDEGGRQGRVALASSPGQGTTTTLVFPDNRTQEEVSL